MSRYPIAPLAVVYFAVLIVNAIGRAVGVAPAQTVVEVGLFVITIATLAVAGLVLRRDPRSGFAWCALVAALCLLVVEVYMFQADPLDNSIGLGAFLLVGWPLLVLGAFTPRPVSPAARA